MWLIDVPRTTPPQAAIQVLQTWTSGHFTKPLSPHENRPFLGSPEWLQGALHRIPAEMCAVVLLGENVPQAWEEPSADDTRSHRGGTEREEGRLDATREPAQGTREEGSGQAR